MSVRPTATMSMPQAIPRCIRQMCDRRVQAKANLRIFGDAIRAQIAYARANLEQHGFAKARIDLVAGLTGILGEIAAGQRLRRDFMPMFRSRYGHLGSVVMLANPEIKSTLQSGNNALGDYYVGIFNPPQRTFWVISEVEVKSAPSCKGATATLRERRRSYWNHGGELILEGDQPTRWTARFIGRPAHWILNGNPHLPQEGTMIHGCLTHFLGWDSHTLKQRATELADIVLSGHSA